VTRAPRKAEAPAPIRLELVDLETFLAVAILGSFSAAARQFNITQPSVSGRIQRLEASLGTKLLLRTTRRVELTPRGALLRGEAERTLAGLRGLAESFRVDAAAARGRVVVAATPMVAATMLPDVIRSHGERWPAVAVQVRDLRHGDALEALAAGEADVAVVAFDGKDKRFRFQLLRAEDMVLIVPPRHPLARSKRAPLERIAAFPLMMLEQYEGMKARIAAEVARHGMVLKPAVSAGNLNTLMGMLDAGMGVLLLPRVMARRSLEAGNILVEIEGIALSRSFCIVMRHDAEPTAALRRFCRHLKQEMAQ
jgi:DNA-binding transcriptional LysR family regulator